MGKKAPKPIDKNRPVAEAAQCKPRHRGANAVRASLDECLELGELYAASRGAVRSLEKLRQVAARGGSSAAVLRRIVAPYGMNDEAPCEAVTLITQLSKGAIAHAMLAMANECLENEESLDAGFFDEARKAATDAVLTVVLGAITEPEPQAR